MTIERWTEVERTFDVDSATALPTLLGVDGVTRVGQGVQVDLEAVYFDTTRLDLVRRGITVRRRTGGADEGWYLKLPDSGDARVEVRRPLGRAVKTVPGPLLDLVRAFVRDRRAVPVARIATRRREHALLDGEGTVLGVVCDDHVRAEQLHGGGEVQEWREWVVELVTGDPSLLDAVEGVLRGAGARPSQSSSKLVRALADTDLLPPPPPPPSRKEIRKASAEAGVVRQVKRQIEKLHEQDRRVRVGEDGSVHKMRIAARRLRSALKTYGPLFADESTDTIGEDLRWLGQALSPARDAQVLRKRLHELVAAEPPDLVLGPVAALIDDELRAAEVKARNGTLDALGDTRYFRLLDALDDFVEASPFAADGEEPARKVFPRLLLRDERRLRRAVKNIPDDDDGEQREVALHEARKKAKRLRYAAQSMTPVLGKPADRLAAKVKRIQESLGEYQDTVMSRRLLRDFGARAHVGGQNGFTFGRLHALEEARGQVAVREFEDAWTRLNLKRLRRRLKP